MADKIARPEGIPIIAAAVAVSADMIPASISVCAKFVSRSGPNAHEIALATISDTMRSCVAGFLAVRANPSVNPVEIPVSARNKAAVRA